MVRFDARCRAQEFFLQSYFNSTTTPATIPSTTQLVSPFAAEHGHTGLPDATVVLATYDPLRGEE